jgi:peptidoglycan/LPS O-acetylase OafA/YrhL
VAGIAAREVLPSVAFPQAKGSSYLLALLVAFGVFLAFAAMRFGGEAAPLTSVALASLLTAAGAAALAVRWPARPWRWGVLVSSAFWLYLLLVFAAFAANGEAQWWPLIEALVICAFACACAAGAASMARRAGT